MFEFKELWDSTKKGTLTVKVSEKDKNAEHIDIEYATDPDFTDAKAVSVDEKDTIKIKGLEKGKKYYLRARQVTYYGDGGMSVSAWSIVKSKTTKNAAHSVAYARQTLFAASAF